MSRWLLAVAVSAFLAAPVAAEQPEALALDWSPELAELVFIQPGLRLEYRTVTRYRTVYRFEYRDVQQVVTRRIPETVVREVQETVRVPSYREEVRQRTVMVPVTRLETQYRTVVRTEWRREVRERTEMVSEDVLAARQRGSLLPAAHEEGREPTVTGVRHVAEAHVQPVLTGHPVAVRVFDPCTGRVGIVSQMVPQVTMQSITVLRPLVEPRAEAARMVATRVAYLESVPVRREETVAVQVPVVRMEPRVELVRVPVYGERVEVRTRRVPVTTWREVREVVTARVPCSVAVQVPYPVTVCVPVWGE